MTPIYRIHPAIGIARLGNSPDGFYIGPEAPAALPIACDAKGNALLSPDGKTEQAITTFKDEEGRIKRQAARFQVYVYDDESPEGRPLELGQQVAGGGNQGKLVDIEWRVWPANKKAAWYEFKQLEGEHGYAKDHPRRNADVKGKQARRHLMIDPGPRTVNATNARAAHFTRDGGDQYAPTFPPKLKPSSIDTLGELKTDDRGRLLVLGGYGNSGSWNYGKIAQPRIDHYANNDGWFDDTSDGPVMARLVMSAPAAEGSLRFVDVEYPAWVVTGYPGYVPEILDMITMDEVVEDLNIRQFATRTDLYGQSGTFGRPQHVDFMDPEALAIWRAGRLQWNPDYRPWFFRDIWNILFRPDEFSYLSDILGLSNFPHNQSTRGTFDPYKLAVPPEVNWKRVRESERRCVEKLRSGELFLETLEPALDVLEKQAQAELGGLRARSGSHAEAGSLDARLPGLLTTDAALRLQQAVAEYVAALEGAAADAGPARPDPLTAPDALADAGTTAQSGHADAGADAAASPGTSPEAPAGSEGLSPWLAAFRQAGARPGLAAARDVLDAAVDELLAALPGQETESRDAGGVRFRAAPTPENSPAVGAAEAGDEEGRVMGELGAQLRIAVQDHLRKLHTGRLLEECRRKAIAANTHDPYGAYRRFLFELLRQPGEENRFFAGGSPDGRTHNLPLMPLLNGDNPLSNTLPSKFVRLTDTQYFLLRQWAEGRFYNEKREGWDSPDPWNPYAGWVNRTGRDLDRAVMSNVVGGAFCPGGEVGWVMRNPSIYHAPYRIKADPAFYAFQETAAQSNTGTGPSEPEFSSYISQSLSHDNNFDVGLQPGDLTKYMALPWQADFNECSTEVVDVTYPSWNLLYPGSDGDSGLARAQRQWESLWWPAHRPMEVFQSIGPLSPDPSNYEWVVWARGVPQTKEGDFKMVTEWWRLGFVRKNPFANPNMRNNILPPPQIPPYANVEYTPRTPENDG
ncbi:MAG TPA: LodA/GoxA family CTQ-dependent oxidase [Longimicrobium sp.]|nr:LodA/GoxA family CTQ-dependent oxidase [Longimicrobium sp.]